MPHTFRGRLCGYLCGGFEEPLSDTIVRLYRTDEHALVRATATVKETFEVLDVEHVEKKADRLLAETTTDETGRFEIHLPDEYEGSAFDVDIRLESVPGRTASEIKPVHASLTTLQPRWRSTRGGPVASWEYCLPERNWCHLRSLFEAWIVCGQVSEEGSEEPVSGVQIHAFDADILEDDALGSATTSADGFYRIYYTTADFERTPAPWLPIELRAGPDLYFRVETTGGALLTEPRSRGREPDRENVGVCTRVDLEVPETPIPEPTGPTITAISPEDGYAGTMVTISGAGFAATREGNTVTFGGTPALVIEASPTELTVLVGSGTDTGAVTVTVTGDTVIGPEFEILAYPNAGAGEDGPPISFTGTGSPAAGESAGDIPSTGTANVLVSIVNPKDQIPPNKATLRQAIIDIWDDVTTFYDQASFNALTVDVDVISDWHTLSGNRADYYKANSDPGYPNIDWGTMDRLVTEAAHAADNDSRNLNDYDLMAVVINLNGTFIRGWGGFSRQNFKYKNATEGLDIDLTTDNPLPLLVVGEEDLDWGRCAHEVGHGLVDSSGASLTDQIGAVTLGEDVYGSDLVDPSEATADDFEMMGAHDSHPLFSAYYMSQLGYYDEAAPEHIKVRQWDRNPFSDTFEIVAHGLNRNSAADRCHALKIEVTDGLAYYIEVRQRPGTTSQVFDDHIPVGTAPNDGGVVVTRVLTDEVNMNQQTRFITLLHETRVLKQGETAIDPARDLTISVTDDGVVNRPLVCEVSVEWAQDIAPDPDGTFDLNLTPWDDSWQTPDIWVDRNPYGDFDKPDDSEGRPQGNGDKPRPNEINRFTTRVHNDGADAANNVQVTFYSVEPPGVGDNGNWAPLETKTLANVTAGGSADLHTNWVPAIDRHTCLKVYVQQQLGEISGGNNSAQENVFEFTAPAASVPDVVTMPVAVRNPLDKRELVHLRTSRVPAGYGVHFPHRWVWLDAKQERTFDLTIIPTEDYFWYTEFRETGMTTPISLRGDLPHGYEQKVAPDTYPASWAFPMGGVTMRVTPKRRVSLELTAEPEGEGIWVKGWMAPALENQEVRIIITDRFGFRDVVTTMTDATGEFSTMYSLEEAAKRNEILVNEEPMHLPPGHPGSFPVWGTYQVQAHTHAADDAAETQSNTVSVTVSK